MDSKVLRSITLLLTALFLTLGGGESHGTLSGVGTEIAQPAAVARMLQSTCSVPGLYMVPAGATPGWGPSSAAAVIGPVGYSQLVQGRTSNSSLASLANGTCPGAPNPSYSVGNASYILGFILNFGVVPQPGWLLSLDTCQTSSPTASFTTLFLGSNCPTSWGAFKCFASNAQNACPNTAVTHLSRIVNVTLTAANALQYLYAFVTLPIATAPVYGGGTGVRVAWQLYIPATPSVTPSPSMSTSISASATPSPSRPAYCYGIEDFAVSMYGLAGAWNGSVIDPLLQWPIPDAFGPMWTFAPTADDPYYYAYTAPSYCTNDEVPVSDDGYGYPIAYSGVGPPAPFPMPPLPVVLVGIDLGDQWLPGGTLVVDTCGSGVDTEIWVGDGCPIDAPTFDCLAYNDNDWVVSPPAGANCGTSGGSRTITTVVQALQYVMVSAKANGTLPAPYADYGTGAVTLHYAYYPPTPSPSGSASGSASSSVSSSGSPTSSPSASATPSQSESNGASPSTTPTTTRTPSHTPTRTRTSSATPTRSHTLSSSTSATVTASITRTPMPTGTRTATASLPPTCLLRVAFTAYVNGTSGSVSLSTVQSPWALSAAFGALSCNQETSPGTFMNASTGAKHVIALDLGVGTELGGLLTVDTCSNPFFDTQLYVGYGCPVSVPSFACFVSDDDFCPRQSLVSFYPSGRWVYVVVAGYETNTGPYTLTWSYSLAGSPSVPFSSTATRTASVTLSHSPGASASLTPSWSRSHSASPSPPPTASKTASAGGTPSASSSPGSCLNTANGIYFTAHLSGASGSYFGSLSGQVDIYPYGNCVSADYTLTANPSYYNTVYPGPQILFSLDLGFTPPPGGSLYIDTCNQTTFDTVLFVGTSCPLPPYFATMQCVLSNDDACSSASPNDPNQVAPQSRVLLTNTSARVYYVMLTGYYDAVGTYQLSWYWNPQPSASPSASPTPTAALSLGASPSATPTGTGTSPPTSSATPTPSPTPSNRQNSFHNSSVLVLRAGTGLASLALTPGQALPLFFDEVGTVGAGGGGVLQTIALPYVAQAAGSSGAACTLSFGYASNWYYDVEGVPSLSYNKQSVVLPCYDTTAGEYLDASNTKVVAILRPDGSLDTTSLQLTNAFNGIPSSVYPQAIRTALTNDSSSFLIAGTGGLNVNSAGIPQPFHGLLYALPGSPNVIAVTGKFNGTAGFRDMRYAYWDSRGFIYVADTAADGSGFTGLSVLNGASLGTGVTWHDGSGVPNLYQVPGTVPGWANYPTIIPGPFVFDALTSVWLAVSQNLTYYNIGHWTRALVLGVETWTLHDYYSVDTTQTVISLTGRAEPALGNAWTLYAATKTDLWQVTTGVNSTKTNLYSLAAAPGQYIRGVVFAPLNPGWIVASPSPPSTPTGTATASVTHTPTTTMTSSATLSHGATPSKTPSMTATQTASGTSTTTASSTRSVSLNRFQASSVLLLRAGDGANAYLDGSYAPLFLDEMDTSGLYVNAPLSSVALPSGALGTVLAPGSYRCTLAGGAGYLAEGFPGLTGDGKAAVIPCYDRAPNSAYAGGAGKTVALVSSTGVVDTSTRATDAYIFSTSALNINTFCSAYSANGSNFVLAGSSAPLSGDAGLRGIVRGAVSSTLLATGAGLSDLRGATVYGGKMYAAFGPGEPTGPGVAVVGAPPSSLTSTAFPMLPVPSAGVPPFAGLSLQSLLFETPARLWASDDSAPSLAQLRLFTANASAGGAWNASSVVLFDSSGQPVYSFTGRNESSASGGPFNSASFVIYAATQSALYRYNATASRITLLASATSNTVFRGVTLTPQSAGFLAATPSATPTQSSSATGTPPPTPSKTATSSVTATPSVSATKTPSISATPSLTPSPSPSDTSSASGTSSSSPSGSNTPSVSPSSTRTPTASRSSSGTPTPTRSLSVSSTATHTVTSSRTASPSMSITSSQSLSGTGTQSATGSVSATASRTASTTATVSASVSSPATSTSTSTSSATRTQSATGTPSASHTGTSSSSKTRTPSSSRTGTPSASHTETSSSSRTGTPSASRTATASPSHTATPSSSRTGTPSSSRTGTSSHSHTGTSSSSRTETSSASRTGTASASKTETPSASHSETSSSSKTETPSASHSETPSPSRSGTPSSSHTDTASSSRSGTASASRTPPQSMTSSGSVVLTATSSATVGASMVGTTSSTSTATSSPAASASMSSTMSGTSAATSSAAVSPSMSSTMSSTLSGTSTATSSAAVSASLSSTMSSTLSSTSMATRSQAVSASLSSTMSGTSTGTSSAAVSSSASGTLSGISTATCSAEVSPSMSSTMSSTLSGTSTATSSAAVSATFSSTMSGTMSSTMSGTMSNTAPSTGTSTGSTAPSVSATASRTSTISLSTSMSSTMTATLTATMSATTSATGAASATATVSRSATASSTSSMTPSFTATVSHSALATKSTTASLTASLTSTLTATGSSASTASPTLSASISTSPTLSGTASASRSGTPSSSHTDTPSGSHSGTPSSSKTQSASSSRSGTPSASRTETPSSSRTRTPSSSKSGTPSASKTDTPSASHTATPSTSATRTPSASHSETPSRSRSGTASSSHTATSSGSQTGSGSASKTSTGTPTTSGSVSWTPTASISATPSLSATASQSSTASVSSSDSSSRSSSSTLSSSATPSASSSASSSSSASVTSSHTRTAVPTRSPPPTGTPHATLTAASTHSPPATATRSETATAPRTPSHTTSARSSDSATHTATVSNTSLSSSSAAPTDTPPVTQSGSRSSTRSATRSHSHTRTESHGHSRTESHSHSRTHTATHKKAGVSVSRHETPSGSHAAAAGSVSHTRTRTRDGPSPSHTTTRSRSRSATRKHKPT